VPLTSAAKAILNQLHPVTCNTGMVLVIKPALLEPLFRTRLARYYEAAGLTKTSRHQDLKILLQT